MWAVEGPPFGWDPKSQRSPETISSGPRRRGETDSAQPPVCDFPHNPLGVRIMFEIKLVALLLGAGVLLSVFAEQIGQELFLAIATCLS